MITESCPQLSRRTIFTQNGLRKVVVEGWAAQLSADKKGAGDQNDRDCREDKQKGRKGMISPKGGCAATKINPSSATPTRNERRDWVWSLSPMDKISEALPNSDGPRIFGNIFRQFPRLRLFKLQNFEKKSPLALALQHSLRDWVWLLIYPESPLQLAFCNQRLFRVDGFRIP